MTKEELKQEAEEYVCKRNPLVTKEWFIDAFKKYDKGEKVKYLKDCEIAEYEAYLAGAEPREKRIEELEKEIEELKKTYRKQRNKRIDDLQKENAELKEWKEQTIKARGRDYMDWSKMYDQLTKAKDHIKKLLGCLQQDTNDPQTNYYVVKYMTEAEQFLNSEVEK